MMLRSILALGAVALAACSGASRAGGGGAPAPAALDPVGRYEATVVDDGETLRAVLELRGDPGAYAGTLRVGTRPAIEIATVTTSGPLMVVTANVGAGLLVLRVRFEGTRFRGDWALLRDGGRVEGEKVSGAATSHPG
jgi:hypothetical protein